MRRRIFIEAEKLEKPAMFERSLQAIPDQEGIPHFTRAIAKVAFHCFLYHYPEFTGHESIFDNIKEFIYTGTPNQFISGFKIPEFENPVYDSAHIFTVLVFLFKARISVVGLISSQDFYLTHSPIRLP